MDANLLTSTEADRPEAHDQVRSCLLAVHVKCEVRQLVSGKAPVRPRLELEPLLIELIVGCMTGQAAIAPGRVRLRCHDVQVWHVSLACEVAVVRRIVIPFTSFTT